MTADEMARLHAGAFTDQARAWSVCEFAALCDSPHVFQVGDARCFGLGRSVADEAELLTLATDPAHRRKGLARQCLAAFEKVAQHRGAAACLLEVAADNQAALGLYREAGYAEAGRRPGYYRTAQGIRIDALLLRKTLG